MRVKFLALNMTYLYKYLHKKRQFSHTIFTYNTLLFFKFSGLLVLFSLSPLNANNDLDIKLQTPFVLESDPGKILTASFQITNNTKHKEDFLAKVELPQGWQTIPFEQVRFSIKPGKKSIQILAIKVPQNYPSGQYTIRYYISGIENPSISRIQEFIVFVLPREQIQSFMTSSKRFVQASESYSATLQIVNNGNIASNISVNVKENLNFPIKIDTRSFTLEPKESKTVTIDVKTKVKSKKIKKHILKAEIITDAKKPIKIKHRTQVEVFPLLNEKFDPYFYLPAELTWGYGLKNSKNQLYMQLAGRGFLDEDKTKNIDFYGLFAPIHQTNIYREFGGVPERAFIHYWDPLVDVYAGDGVYSLTYLTMRYRFGAGASFTCSPGPFQAGALFVNDNSSVPRTNWGAFVDFIPNEYFNIKGTFMQTYLTNHSQCILMKEKNTSTGSICANFSTGKPFTVESEYAVTFDGKGSLKNKSAYHLRTFGRIKKDIAYGFEKVVARPNFVGYYNDNDIFTASLNLPLFKNCNGYCSYNSTKSHLENTITNPLTKTRTNIIGLIYSYSPTFYTNLAYNEALHQENFSSQKTHFGSLNIGINYNQWTIQAITELGAQRNLFDKLQKKFWNNYQLYLYFQVTDSFRYSLYTRLGNPLFSERIQAHYTYGNSLSWQCSSQLNLQLLYEYTITQPHQVRKYFNGSISYRFNNGHKFSFKSYFYDYRKEKKNYAFLASYTIPFKLPVSKKKSVSGLSGKIHRTTTDLSNGKILVNCNGNRTLTNEKGEFSFPHLKSGSYNLWVEEADEDLIFQDSYPLQVCLEEGEMKQVELQMVKGSKVSGSIQEFAFKTDQHNLQETELIQKGLNLVNNDLSSISYQPNKNINSAIVELKSETTQQIYKEISDDQGFFSFEKLPPGKYTLSFSNIKIPAHHYLEQQEFTLELFSGDSKEIHAKILPKMRTIRMIDDGIPNTIQLNE